MFQSSSIIPRWYQLEAIDAIYNYFISKNGNPLIGLPGGTGKSIIPALFIHKAMMQWPNQRFLLLTHIKELIVQNSEKLINVWQNAPLGIYSAGLKSKQYSLPIVYAGIQSAARNPSLFGHRDICFVDESHLVSDDESSQYLTFFSTMKLINPNFKIIGMTATPYRMGMGLLTEGKIFTDFCYDMTNYEGFNRLLAEGFMVPLVPKRTNVELDISNVGISKGDYINSQLQDAIDKNEITHKALKEVIQAGENRKSWLIFASGIEHAEHIATMLTSFGINCAAVHSRQKDFGKNDEYNNQALKAFKNGSLRSVVNYSKLTVGFDNPAIDLIADFRPTLSIPLHIQKYCRGTRPNKETNKENCLILDFSRNIPRLGCINDPIIPKKKGNKEGDIPVKICENCGTYNHLKVRFCTDCGNEFQFQVKIVAKAGNAEILRSDFPVVDYFDVEKVIYTKRQKEGKLPYIQATYFCSGGMQGFNEYQFPEYNGYSRHKFTDWWKQRHHTEPPATVVDALKYIHELRTPKRIRVWLNRRYPVILSVEF